MSDVNRILTSLLLSHTIRRHFWRIVVIEVNNILERILVFLETQLVTYLIFSFLISILSLCLLHQHLAAGELQLRHRQGWSCVALCRGEEQKLVLFQRGK